MLKTPRLLSDTTASLIAVMNGNSPNASALGDGFVEIGHFSLDISIWGRNAPLMYMGCPYLGDDLECFGVVDTPAQFITRYRQRLADDVRTFVVSFTHIVKDASNPDKRGGWRWHKWGTYIGDGKPENEYLDEETGFDNGVYVYHVYQIDGPEMQHIRRRQCQVVDTVPTVPAPIAPPKAFRFDPPGDALVHDVLCAVICLISARADGVFPEAAVPSRFLHLFTEVK